MNKIPKIKIKTGCLIYTPTQTQKVISKITFYEVFYEKKRLIHPLLTFVDAVEEVTRENDIQMLNDFEEFYEKNKDFFSNINEFPLHRICKNCEEIFLPKSIDREFCYAGKSNSRCKTAWHRANKTF